MGKPIIIGVLSPVTGGEFYGEVLSGIARRVARENGQMVLWQTLDAGSSSDTIRAKSDYSLRTSWSHVDGVISIASGAQRSYLAELQHAGKPIVLASEAVEGLTAASVVPDNFDGVVNAVKHLVEHGHSRIGFAGNLVQSDMQERFAGYRAAMQNQGLKADPSWCFACPDNGEVGGISVADDLLARGVPITALILATDRNAVGLLRRCGQIGISVPDDLAVVGVDGIERGSFTEPTLSSVNQRFDLVGDLAAELVFDAVRGKEVAPVRHVCASVLVPRGSCGCLPTGGIRLPAVVESDLHHTDYDRRDEIATRMHALLLVDPTDKVGQSIIDGGIDAFRAVVEQAFLTGERIPLVTIREIARVIIGFNPPPEALSGVVEAITEFIYQLATLIPDNRPQLRAVFAKFAAEMSGELWRVQAETYLGRSVGREDLLHNQYKVGMHLLNHGNSDPRHLAWMAATGARVGCLAMWEGDSSTGQLVVQGIYDPDSVLETDTGQVIGVDEFPSASLIDVAAQKKGDVVFVIPVKTGDRNWGLLAVVGEIETGNGAAPETFSQWGTLLSVAFDQESLVESIRTSEERYSLVASATQDGLFDWNLGTGQVYFSDRCLEMLGEDGEARIDDLSVWMRAVHPGDISGLSGLLKASTSGSREPIEIEHRVRGSDGKYRWYLCRALPVGPENGAAHRIVGSLADIEQRKVLESQLRQGALYDSLTGLPNRKLFMERLSVAIRQRERAPSRHFAVVFFDLDGFKLVNDSLGHHSGDLLLQRIGSVLNASLRSVDTASRFGGDEFAVLLHDVEAGQVDQIVERLQEMIRLPMTIEGHEVAVSASVGVASSEGDYHSAEDALRDADIAMYRAKESMPGSRATFSVDMHSEALGRLELHSQLRLALDNEQFAVRYQPIVDAESGNVCHFEALIRWDHPERGLVPPGLFLKAMEDSGMMVNLGRWIIRIVCAQIYSWEREFGIRPHVAINLSNREFWDPALLSHLQQCLCEYDLPSSVLSLEITEGVIMHQPKAAQEIMSALEEAGFELHIDDFGTGYSSLETLHRLPAQSLKIDRSFVHGLGVEPRSEALIRGIVEMGKALGMTIIAEGVETEMQEQMLLTIGCNFFQGYRYSMPVDGTAAGPMLETTFEELRPSPRLVLFTDF